MLNPRRASFLAVALLFAGAQLSCSSSDGSGSPAGSPSGSQPGDAAPESGQGDSTAPDEGPCEQGALRCLTATEAAICQDGAWTVSQACRSGQLCFDGRCLTPEPCTPKTIDGCFSANAKRRCNEAGSAYEPVKCEAGELCVLGECKVTDCAPGQARCADQKNRQQCTPEGEWGQPQPCGEGHTCTAGRCLSGCRSDPKFTYSSVGCEYWSVDLDQSTKATIMTDHTPPAVAPHSVALSNPGDFPVVVTFSTKATGITLPFGEETIEPGQVREFEMPRMDLEGAGIFDRSVRILSSGPVVATQFNPKDYGNTYSNDSSLLLPADLLGTEYVILGWESQAKLPFEVYPALLGYFTVIAVEEGETSVTVQLSSESNPVIPNGAPLAPGVPHNYKLASARPWTSRTT